VVNLQVRLPHFRHAPSRCEPLTSATRRPLPNPQCFVAICLFTKNVKMAVICTASIMAIITVLLGTMIVVLEWKFGAIEAVCVTIFVGFSVDYCLHLAHAYSEEHQYHSRYLRVRAALTELGSSVFAAAVTTLGSAVPLFFCTIQVFVQMGKVVAANTVLSCTFAVFYFMPLLAILGPRPDDFHPVEWLLGKCGIDISRLGHGSSAAQRLEGQGEGGGAKEIEMPQRKPSVGLEQYAAKGFRPHTGLATAASTNDSDVENPLQSPSPPSPSGAAAPPPGGAGVAAQRQGAHAGSLRAMGAAPEETHVI
jgi:hypothetical protein